MSLHREPFLPQITGRRNSHSKPHNNLKSSHGISDAECLDNGGNPIVAGFSVDVSADGSNNGIYYQGLYTVSQNLLVYQLAQGINRGAGALNNPKTYACWYVASAAIGGLAVEGGLTAAAEAILPILQEDAGVGQRLLRGVAKNAIDRGVKGAAATCGVSEFLH